MDLIAVLNTIEISEFSLYLDIEDMISLYLVCISIRNKIDASLSTIYSFSSQPTSFSHLVLIYDTERVSRRSAPIIGLNRSLARAATIDSIPLVQLFLSKGATDTKTALGAACRAHTSRVANFLITCPIGDQDTITSYLEVVSENGDLELMKTLLKDEDSSVCYSIALIGAAANGHVDTVKYILDYCKEEFKDDNDIIYSIQEGIELASNNGHIDVVKLLLEENVGDYNRCLTAAAVGGHKEIMSLMLDKGANTYIAMAMIITVYDQDIADMMSRRGVIDCDYYRKEYIIVPSSSRDTFIDACYEGHLDIVRKCLSEGKTVSDMDKGLIQATVYGHIDIIRLLIEGGADEYEEPLRIATAYCHESIVNLLMTYV